MPEGDTIHNAALRMGGKWGVYERGRRWMRSPHRAWLVIRTDGRGGTYVYDRAGRPCRICATSILAHGQSDDNRTTYWCPKCQI